MKTEAQKRYEKSAKGKANRKRHYEKNRAYYAAWQKRRRATPAGHAEHWNNQLKSRYGLDLGGFIDFLLAQEGVCAVCKQPGAIGGKNGDSFVVDHDHQTGKVRGVIHVKCNAGLGAFDDSPAKLRQAADYLEKHA